MEKTHQTISSAWISLFVSIFITGLKFYAFSITHSQAVFSDALESIVNVLTAIVALIVMKFVAEPADERHPYGHGKLEYFSSAFEGGMIAFAALAIAYEAIRSLIQGPTLKEVEMGMLVVVSAAFLNFLLGMHLKVVGRKYNSLALQASSAHVMSDVITTIGVLIGLMLVKVTGWSWLDPVVALLVAAQLIYSGYLIVRQSAGGLIDEIDLSSLGKLVEAINKNRKVGLIDFHNVRIIRSGKFHHVDAHIVVPDFWETKKVHDECHEFEKKVVELYPFDGEFAFHVDPCQQHYCSICDLADCPIRLRPFSNCRIATVDSVIKGPEKDPV
jgi:cation diffusion facilitator family transporter